LIEKKILKVLLTYGNYKHTWAASKALFSNGHVVHAIGGGRSLVSSSKYVEKVVFKGLKLLDSNLERFLELLTIENYDVILGIGANSVEFLSKNREDIGHHAKLILPPKLSLEIALNKMKSLEIASNLKIKVPRSAKIERLSETESHKGWLTGPFIIKSSSELRKDFETLYFDNYDHFREVSLNLKELDHSALVQERIFGVGEAFCGIYSNGTLINHAMHRRLRENPISGGPSTKAEIIFKQDLFNEGAKLLEYLNWHGVGMVEFKRDNNNDLFLMEINPKFWGSLDLSIVSGVNFPLIAVNLAMEKHVIDLKMVAQRTVFQWPFHGDFALALKHPSLVGPIVKDFINPKIKKNFYLDDIQPIIKHISNTSIQGLLKKSKVFGDLARKMANNGLKFGIFRWITELTGIPLIIYSQITPNIIIGGRLSKVGILYLRLKKVNAILNLRDEFDDKTLKMNIRNYCHLPTKDFGKISDSNYQVGIKFIKAQTELNNIVYIHCAEGISRAPSMALAFFVSEGKTLNEGLSMILEKRPFISILDNQLESVRKLFL
jgi:predicted ATP-grasp superfamily ATP-dependent carboligase/protein-tyrosine phosphatase